MMMSHIAFEKKMQPFEVQAAADDDEQPYPEEYDVHVNFTRNDPGR